MGDHGQRWWDAMWVMVVGCNEGGGRGRWLVTMETCVGGGGDWVGKC